MAFKTELTMSVCALVLTHMSPPQFTNLITVPYIVTTDVESVSWALDGPVFIDTAHAVGESAIGAYMHGAIDRAFYTFPDCTVLAVLEDDEPTASRRGGIIKCVRRHGPRLSQPRAAHRAHVFALTHCNGNMVLAL